MALDKDGDGLIRGIFDIDHADEGFSSSGAFDSHIGLWLDNENGTFTLLAENDDDSNGAFDATGSAGTSRDSLLALNFNTTGHYVIGIAEFGATFSNTGISGGLIGTNDSFDLNISIEGHVVPVPAAVWLFGSGLMGLIAVSRRRAA